LDRLVRLLFSCSVPTKTDIETALAFNLKISFIEVTRLSLDKALPTTDTAPDTRSMMGLGRIGSMQFLKTPRVIISASAYCQMGLMVSPGFSRQWVGPWKYPWSIGKKTALPSFWISLDKRFFIPHSIVYHFSVEVSFCRIEQHEIL
jgi:hypothetical protein